jgi:hypothetical protein
VRLFHDPEARGVVSALVQEGMEAGGPAALERSGATWREIPTGAPTARAPGAHAIQAEAFFRVEVGSYERFLPDEEALAAIVAHVLVVASSKAMPSRRKRPAGDQGRIRVILVVPSGQTRGSGED